MIDFSFKRGTLFVRCYKEVTMKEPMHYTYVIEPPIFFTSWSTFRDFFEIIQAVNIEEK